MSLPSQLCSMWKNFDVFLVKFWASPEISSLVFPSHLLLFRITRREGNFFFLRTAVTRVELRITTKTFLIVWKFGCVTFVVAWRMNEMEIGMEKCAGTCVQIAPRFSAATRLVLRCCYCARKSHKNATIRMNAEARQSEIAVEIEEMLARREYVFRKSFQFFFQGSSSPVLFHVCIPFWNAFA